MDGHKTALTGYYTCLSRDLLLIPLEVTHTTHTHQRSRTKQFQETWHSLHVPGLITKFCVAMPPSHSRTYE